MTVRFDDSLEELARQVVDSPLGAGGLSEGVVVRDATGRLGFFASADLLPEQAEALRARLLSSLGAYARGSRVLVLPDEPGAQMILAEAAQPVTTSVGTVRMLDRWIVGVDWLRPPAERAAWPSRFAFTSLKGGVGRTTALAVCAGDLAAQGRSVLVVDLDLEAPGIGPLLVRDEHLPEFGLVDALVESGLAELGDAFYADLVATASVDAFEGRVRVLPALGKRAARHPGNVLAKLARVYNEHPSGDGVLTFLDQVCAVIDACERFQAYDAVLVDARSGLHESTAAAMMGLGAEVFLFGADERQTFHGYEALFAHLRAFVPEGDDPASWVDRLNAVQAKAPADAARCRAYAERWQLMVSRVLLPRDDEQDVPPERPVRVPLRVLQNRQFEGFDPLADADVLVRDLVDATFGQLTERVRCAVEASEEGRGEL